jgi:hypothetical protein
MPEREISGTAPPGLPQPHAAAGFFLIDHKIATLAQKLLCKYLFVINQKL